jgi:hypothetical protein
VRNLNHHISKKIVEIATKTESCIKLERLSNIRQNKKHGEFSIFPKQLVILPATDDVCGIQGQAVGDIF